MVGGVHELAGLKRTVEVEDERLVAQRGARDERRERRERREQRREEGQRAETDVAGRAQTAKRRKDVGRDVGNGGNGDAAAFGAHAGGWTAGGLGDRTGIG